MPINLLKAQSQIVGGNHDKYYCCNNGPKLCRGVFFDLSDAENLWADKVGRDKLES
jgi:hypothetical protein